MYAYTYIHTYIHTTYIYRPTYTAVHKSRASDCRDTQCCMVGA